MPEAKLLFVYAVDSGVFNGLKDYVHKLASPNTYPCALCALTYGPLGERKEWACALEGMPVKVEFLHRDEFEARFPNVGEHLPAAFLVTGGSPTTPAIITAQEIAGCKSSEELARLVERRIQGLAKAA